jgi:phytoene/squalene synthetase
VELYTSVSQEMSRRLTRRYSSSFSAASQLFPAAVQTEIYNIYGLVRIADEIVDTYEGDNRQAILDQLESETYDAIVRGYSANPIVHSFAGTARRFGIDKALITPFFESMRMDITPRTYTKKVYETYVYGSAEVVGLMCLKVFTNGDVATYNSLSDGARRLGAAYQKVNFLRDIADDYRRLSRLYFPGETFDAFDESSKQRIIKDIENDFAVALPYITSLPDQARLAVATSYQYYRALLSQLSATPAETIKQTRVSVPRLQKLTIIGAATLKRFV